MCQNQPISYTTQWTHPHFSSYSDTAEKDDEVEFECKSKTGGGSSKDGSSDGETTDEPQSRGITITPDEIKDKIKYKVKTTDEGIRVKLEYKHEVETEDMETETKTKVSGGCN